MKRSVVVLLAIFLLTPIIFYCAIRAVAGNKNDVTDWLPASYPETKRLNWFRNFFVADQFVIISWDGCQLGDPSLGSQDDPRIAKLANALRSVTLQPADGSESFHCFSSITTAREILDELTSSPSEIPYAEAVRRLKGTLIGVDGKQTCLIASLSKQSIDRMREVLGRPNDRPLRLRPPQQSPLFIALAEVGLSNAEVRLGGPPIDNVAIDEEGERTLIQLALLSGAFGIALTWWSLKSLRMTFIVFGCGILSAALSLATVYITGSTMDAILMSMPALIYVLAVSGAIHFINYYREAIHDGGFEGAVARARIHAFKPALLCSVTTAIGLASLVLSDIIPIGKFGGYSAAGVLSMLAVLFIVLPAIMQLWPWHPPEVPHPTHSEQTSNNRLRNPKLTWLAWAKAVHRHHLLVMTGCLAVIVALCFGLPRVTTSIDLLKLFSEEARILADYRWFEEKLGRLVPIEVVIRFPRTQRQEHLPEGAQPVELLQTMSFLERLEMVQRVQNAIQTKLGTEGEDLVGATMSAVTFAPNLADGSNSFVNATMRYVVSEELTEHHEQLEDSGYLAIDEQNDEELWRISVRVAAFHDFDHGQLVNHLKSAVEPVLATQRASLVVLQSLADRKDALPTGSKVLIWTDKPQHQQAVDLASTLVSKRIHVDRLEAPFEKLTASQLKKLSEYDGLVLSEDADLGEQIHMIRSGVKVLGVIHPEYQAPADHSRHASVVYTGVVPIVYKAQHALLDSLVESSWWSFASITPLMMFVCRGIFSGLVAMIPNVLPILVVFGGMGWLGIPVDIGSMMAASIALGVAVDDTIHFLAWFREDYEKLKDRSAATISAYSRSATPTLQAALVNGLGLSVFAVSSFTPTARFGWLMLTILFAGVIAELVMLPALLFSPLGKTFSIASERRWIPRMKLKTRLFESKPLAGQIRN